MEAAYEEKKLIFTKYLTLENEWIKALHQPDSFDHVRHLTNNLYYAWYNNEPRIGSIYQGEFQ